MDSLREDARISNRILRQAEAAGPSPPDPDRALEQILARPGTRSAFVRWYREEIIQFWEGHCDEA